ncbi:MAG: DUF1501 domain-containing protein [Daejeonella sp.]
MKRRDFLAKAIPAGVVMPSLINGLTFKAFGSSPLMAALTAAGEDSDHVLVIIQMNGGNDGLNTVIPLDQYDNLVNARSNIILPNNKILKLGNFDTALHPSMQGLNALYKEGKLQVIQSVGYPQPSFSHFRATDIWLTASDSTQVLNSGWTGRYLDQEFSGYPIGFPNSVMPDPLAIQIGSFISPAFQGPSVGMGLAISDPVNFYNLINGIQYPAPNTNAGKELTYIRQVSQQTQQYSTAIKSAASKVTVQGAYPTGNSLADQLKIVSRLIAGGLKTRIYMVNIGGFDTHAAQVNAGATDTGSHANLLMKVSDAVKAFMDDLKFQKASKRVIGMTFSEFGRRIQSNSSGGTDHGAAAPLFIFGDYVQSGVLGKNPIIPSQVTSNDNVPMQYDFRSVYASILQKWFCVSDTTLQTVMLKNFQSLPIISSRAPCTTGTIADLNEANDSILISNYPNPFQSYTNITYKSKGGHVLIQIFDIQGRLVRTVVDELSTAGDHAFTLDNPGYAPGLYYARFQNQELQQVRTMMVAR